MRDYAIFQEFSDAPIGMNVRVMEWNIWLGGREAGGETNVGQLIELIRREDPDILFMQETYGSGQKILDGLNWNVPNKAQYNGVRITDRQGENKDNLWIFTRYKVVEMCSPINVEPVSSFNFGGIKIQLPNGREVLLFNIWLWYLGHANRLTDQTIKEIKSKSLRTYTDAEIIATDFELRLQMARIILQHIMPYLQEKDNIPIIIAGDFNTMSYRDWSAEFADAPGHEGLVLPWPVTQLFEEAGLTDTFRWANPDASRYPGSTWSPHHGYGDAPARIDYIWTSGAKVRILGSYTLDCRLPAHTNEQYPFYSDHAAVVTDLIIC